MFGSYDYHNLQGHAHTHICGVYGRRVGEKVFTDRSRTVGFGADGLPGMY